MSDQDNNMEQSFNDAELQDIMNEIENLEKEFVEEAQSPESETIEAQAETVPEDEVTPQEVDTAPVQEHESTVTEEVSTAVEETSAVIEEAPVAIEEESSPEEEVAAAEEIFAAQDIADEATAEQEEETAPGFIDAEETIVSEVVSEEVENVVPLNRGARPSDHGHEGGHMSFSGSGQMDMELNFQLGSEQATVNVSNGTLNISLTGVNLVLSESGCEVNMAGGVKFHVPIGHDHAGKKAA